MTLWEKSKECGEAVMTTVKGGDRCHMKSEMELLRTLADAADDVQSFDDIRVFLQEIKTHE